MLLIGCGLIIFNIVLRGFLLPAEYSLAGDPSNYPRIFFNPLNRTLYFAAEAGSRWIGSGLIAGSIVGFEGNLTNILLGGGITGLMGGVAAPAVSMFVAIKIHPWFKGTLKEAALEEKK